MRLTKEEGRSSIEELVARELPVTIILNDQELVTMLCSPKDLEYLVVGFLSSEGLLKSKDEIKRIVVDGQRGVVRLESVEDKGFAQDVLFNSEQAPTVMFSTIQLQPGYSVRHRR